MHTKDFLAQELEKAGLNELAARARTGEFHDFLSHHEAPAIMLLDELTKALRDGNAAAHPLIRRHMNGDFDASLEESDEWANSAEGRAAFKMLSKGKSK